MKKKRFLFLMSDTGGGHRAAAEAIRDGLYARLGQENVSAELLDVFRQSNFPMNYAPDFYPWLVNHTRQAYGMSFNLSNTNRRAAFLSQMMYLTNARRFNKIAQTHPVDCVISVHSIITRPTMKAWLTLEERPPYLTLVTDLVSTHIFWYDTHADFTMLPTQTAYDRGIKAGLSEDKMRITGLPVNPRFMEGLIGKEESRKTLGWEQGKMTILMVAGSEGMGNLYETARAINNKRLDCQLVVIAGRNENLKTRLESAEWNQPTHIYPYVTNMPQLMSASDIIVTKAGPATITEAAIAGLPMILMDAIPYQEDGNVTYVLENDAGAWSPEPNQVADVVETWLSEGATHFQQRVENARRIARPEAVWDIVDEVIKWSEHGMIKNEKPDDLWNRVRDFITAT